MSVPPLYSSSPVAWSPGRSANRQRFLSGWMMDSYASGKIQLEESEDNASVSEQTRQQLMALANAPFNEAPYHPLTDNAQLDLSSLTAAAALVKREAPSTVLRSRKRRHRAVQC